MPRLLPLPAPSIRRPLLAALLLLAPAVAGAQAAGVAPAARPAPPVVTPAVVAYPAYATAGALHAELARMDSVLFDYAYASCDLPKLRALFAADAEFYHDRGGFSDAATTMASFGRLTADCPKAKGIVREVMPGTLAVYPIANYGAVQTGLHWFVTPGATHGTLARFTTLWRKEPDGRWLVTRVLSYDHRDGVPMS